MSHILLAGLLATLASGFITLSLLASRPEIRGLSHFGGLIANILLFNLLVILGLAGQFLDSSAWKSAPDLAASAAAKGIMIVILLVLGLLKVGWTYSLELLALRLLDRPRPAGMKAAFGAAGGLLIVVAGAWWAPFLGEARFPFVSTAFSVFEFVVLAVVIATAIGLIYRARNCKDVPTRKAVSAFGLIYLVLFTASLVFVVAKGGQAPRADETYSWANALGLLLFNPALYLWARRSAGVFRTEPVPEIVIRPDLITRYGISGREFEIIALICQGKANQQIADELCISVQTVKDHNYNIFQKTGVRNRTQLARLFMHRAGDGNPGL
jgi:DNA-binding CsgD family transcriptional regulator